MSDWDAAAADWDGDATRAYADGVAALVVARCAEHAIDLAAASICDFGAGTGLLVERLAPRCRRIEATDTSAAMLERIDGKVAANRWPHVTTAVEPSGDAYDVVVCSSVLAFVDDAAATIRDLVGRLRPGGLFVHTDWEVTQPGDDHGFTIDQVRRLLREAGLESVTAGHAFEVHVEGHTMRPIAGSGLAALG